MPALARRVPQRHPFLLATSNHRLPVPSLKRESLLIVLCTSALLIGWTLLAGKDASWDVYNHHLYLPFSLLSGHYRTDLFAAGPQSYQSPIGYLPGYLLARSSLPAWSVGALLTILQATPIAWSLHRLTVAIWGEARSQRRWRLLAVVSAISAPALLLVLGTTSNDPLSTGFILVALALVVQRAPTGTWHTVAAGAALGLALAIKLTSGVFFVALAALLLLRVSLRQARWPALLLFPLTTVVVFVLASWQWSGWLWSEFRSPVYPLFNAIFASPYAPAGPTVALRFLPHESGDWLTRIWEIAEFRSYTTTEAFAPDARPLLLLVFGGIGSMLLALRRPAGWSMRSVGLSSTVQLALLTAIAYVLWMATSGNARYALAWFALAGLLVVRAMQVALPARWSLLLATAALAAQLAAYAGAGDRRYNEVPWNSQPFIGADVPTRLAQQPFLHLILGVQTYAAAALFLHPDGALANISGQMALPMDGPLGQKLRARLSLWEGRTRFLMLEPPAYRIASRAGRLRALLTDAPVLRKMDYLTYRVGLRIDWSDCERLVLDPEARPALTLQTGVPKDEAQGIALLSCQAAPIERRDMALEARIAEADGVFALLEAQCPRVFGPRPFTSEVGETVVQRLYGNSDARLNVSRVEGVTLTHFRTAKVISLGTIDQVIASKGAEACSAWEALWKR